MITTIVKLLLLIIMFYSIKNSYDMIQFNKTAILITIDNPNKDKVQLELIKKSPMIIAYPPNNLELTIENMNYRTPGYMINDKSGIISLDQLQKSDTFTIYKNRKLHDDFTLKDYSQSVTALFTNYLSCGVHNSLSISRGSQISPLLKNYRETLLVYSVSGSFTIYLCNPKHEVDIKGMDPSLTKKWAIKINVPQDKVVYIPCEWYYFYESTDDLILVHSEFDSYPTFVFNYLRNK